MPDVDPIPLAQLTTLRTGGLPSRMFDATTTAELVEGVRAAWAGDERALIIGGGSNLFVGDEPFDGQVIRVLTRGIETLPSPRPGYARLRIRAGEEWDAVVAAAVEAGLGGLEAMSGIPGTTGAAPVQNIGAYGREIVQTLVEVDLLDEATGEISTAPAAELGLGFRTSVLKHHYGSEPARRAVILSVTLELEQVGQGERPVPGVQLRSALGLAEGQAVSLRWVREQVLAVRRGKGMVLDPADPDTWSAGSFFQNAIVSASFARTLPSECPRWPVEPDMEPVLVIPLASYDGYVPPSVRTQSDAKVSAAWLIEHAGLRRGFSLPRSRAALSTKHALALTNRGNATAAELAELARFIQGRVHSEFGLILQPEPVLVDVEL